MRTLSLRACQLAVSKRFPLAGMIPAPSVPRKSCLPVEIRPVVEIHFAVAVDIVGIRPVRPVRPVVHLGGSRC